MFQVGPDLQTAQGSAGLCNPGGKNGFGERCACVLGWPLTVGKKRRSTRCAPAGRTGFNATDDAHGPSPCTGSSDNISPTQQLVNNYVTSRDGNPLRSRYRILSIPEEEGEGSEGAVEERRGGEGREREEGGEIFQDAVPPESRDRPTHGPGPFSRVDAGFCATGIPKRTRTCVERRLSGNVEREPLTPSTATDPLLERTNSDGATRSPVPLSLSLSLGFPQWPLCARHLSPAIRTYSIYQTRFSCSTLDSGVCRRLSGFRRISNPC